MRVLSLIALAVLFACRREAAVSRPRLRPVPAASTAGVDAAARSPRRPLPSPRRIWTLTNAG